MRTLTQALLAAQRQGSAVPKLKVEAVNKSGGVVRLDWERLYEGSETDTVHGVTVTSAGTLIRLRVSGATDSRKLYLQRISNPDEQSDFASWNYAGITGCYTATILTSGNETLLFYIDSGRLLWVKSSFDDGVTWGALQNIAYAGYGLQYGLAAADSSSGDIGVFYYVQDTLYAIRRLSNAWDPSPVAWNKSTGDLTGVAAVYDGDWNLAVTGQDSSGNYHLWNLIYGDGDEVVAGQWSDLLPAASAPSDGDYRFHSVFMDRPDVCRCWYIEEFISSESYSRPFMTRTVIDADYAANLWLEPVPFDLSCDCGLAMAHGGDYCWLSYPGGVWRAQLAESRVDITDDVVSLRQVTGTEADSLTVVLRNDDGRFAGLPEPLGEGCRIDISPGYLTATGFEYSAGPAFTLESCEYLSEGGRSVMCLYGYGGRDRLNEWTSGSQFRFNRSGQEASVLQILEFVVARAGLKLEVVSRSSIITSYYPDFTIYVDSRGSSVLRRLLSFVPDEIFVEGDTVYLVNPLETDVSSYSYGETHAIGQGRYRSGAWKVNRVSVAGMDAVAGSRIVKETIDWDQLARQPMRMQRVEDSNISSVQDAAERGESSLKVARLDSVSGTIQVPVNCGQQLLDVIDITDERAGLLQSKKRVTGITLEYEPEKGICRQIISLGAV